MRHSSPKVTKDHNFTEDQEQLRVDHMYDTYVATVDFKKKEQKLISILILRRKLMRNT